MGNGAGLTEAEVAALVEEWYLGKLDAHAPADDVVALLAEEGLEMVFPEATVRTVDGFRRLYAQWVGTYFDEVHAIEDLRIAIAGDRADIAVVVRWQRRTWRPPAPRSEWRGFVAEQTWEVVRAARTGRPVIRRYAVDRFRAAPDPAA